MKQKRILLALLVALGVLQAKSQVLTREDSLNAGLVSSNSPTVLSGYGQAKVDYDLRQRTGTASLTRNVLFVGHRFSKNISFFSELELEDAKVSGDSKGEISMEQLFLKMNVNPSNYIVAGLFVPRIGIINENHLPNTFNGNDRPYVETLIIPSTWRELGIGFYGQSRRIAGLNYSAAIMNGLNAANFQFGSGIMGGRQEGSLATASNIAVTGALLYYIKNFRIQASAYIGGSSGLNKRQADSLQMNYGAFGSPVGLFDFNVQYHNNGWQIKALATQINIFDAMAINRAYANNTPERMWGAYVEAGYNLLRLFKKDTEKNLTYFCRYEQMNLAAKLPVNGIQDDFQKKRYFVTGLTFQPLRSVSIKADYVMQSTGNYNESLYNVNPYNSRIPFYNTNHHFNLGIAYSF
ncbi:MAG: hypothetical protein GC180_10400 [Bacteroidetes bacterium]|nr:hypothetical protein [Bacteroidota bacterium]